MRPTNLPLIEDGRSMPVKENPLPQGQPHHDGRGSSTQLDSFFDDDEQQMQHVRAAAVASRCAAVLSPHTPKTPAEDAVALNPARFAKALQLDEARQKRLAVEANRQRFLLLCVVCAVLAFLCLIVLLGAAVFSGEAHELPTIYRMPVTASNDSDSFNQTDSPNDTYTGSQRYLSAGILTDGDATSPLQLEIYAERDSAAKEDLAKH
ncbi:hypothetical protein MTO96_011052 [Rhipicephalus appendiculatus]